MIEAHELKELLIRLQSSESATLRIAEFSINIRVLNSGTRVVLSTPVYFGGNYVPQSVRKCLKEKPPFDSLGLSSYLRLDEDRFIVILSCDFETDSMSQNLFMGIFEDFYYLAENWKNYLDENDRNDLVKIYIT